MFFSDLKQFSYLPHLSLGLGIAAFVFLCLVLFLLFRMQQLRLQKELQREQHQQLLRKYETLEQENHSLRTITAKLSAQLKIERLNYQEKIQFSQEAKETLTLQFENLAQRIFDEKSSRFGAENRERIEALLKPLQIQLDDFKRRVESIQTEDIRERSSLKKEIHYLREMGGQLGQEAVNLTKALQGDQKTQGIWGELVLERILEKSGLRKNIEYSVQGGFRGENNRLLKPDVIIHLPGNRQVIIDSKVSLSAWEKYTNAEKQNEKRVYLDKHIASLRSHIKTLSEKNYPAIKDLVSLDFVLLFLPIDASFVEACKEIPNLFNEAYEKKIIITTPTTLLVTLRTIENLWRYQQQQYNADKIAQSAGQLYDKFCGFLDEMDKVGKQLATCTATYEHALSKLATGRGNLVSQAQKLTEMGVSSQKNIPERMKKAHL